VTDRDHFDRELRRTEHGRRAGTHVRLAAFATNGALVGLFALNEIVRGAFQSAYASWQVGSDRLGLGFGTEGVCALLDLAFESPPSGLGLHRVQANIMPTNVASLRIAEKAGFRREGLALRYLHIAGRWEDHEMLAVTSEDARPRR
jgi:ribosomal-protein-alanine N-acetyltransferase